MKKKLILFALAISVTTSLVGCNNNNDTSTLLITGSTSIGPVVEKLDAKFEVDHSEIKTEVQQNGSSAGIQAILSNTSDIGMSSRELTDEELSSGILPIPIAIDGIAIIVHPDNPVSNLTIDQLHDIYTGTISNWRDLGGKDEDIIVISREAGSGTRTAFEELLHLRSSDGLSLIEDSKPLISDGNGSIKSNVSLKPRAIGFVSFDLIDDTIKPINIDNIAPTIENIENSTYSLSRPFFLVTKDSPKQELIQTYLDFVLSEEGQQVISENGLIPSTSISNEN